MDKSIWRKDLLKLKSWTGKSVTHIGGTSTSYPIVIISSRTCQSNTLKQAWFQRLTKRMIHSGTHQNIPWSEEVSLLQRLLPICLTIQLSCQLLERMIIVVNWLSIWCQPMILESWIFANKWTTKSNSSPSNCWENLSTSTYSLTRPKSHQILKALSFNML